MCDGKYTFVKSYENTFQCFMQEHTVALVSNNSFEALKCFNLSCRAVLSAVNVLNCYACTVFGTQSFISSQFTHNTFQAST